MVAKKRNRASTAVFAILMSRQSKIPSSRLERKDQLSELGMDGRLGPKYKLLVTTKGVFIVGETV